MKTKWIMAALAIAVGACGSSSSSNPGSSTDSGTDSGSVTLTPRICGNGQPCSDGATCSYSSIESGVECECDASGHFFCDGVASAGAPPFETCSTESACNTGTGGSAGTSSCTQTNGWCTRVCECNGACQLECTGTGPAQGELGQSCDIGYCSTDFGAHGGCQVKDGSCDYAVDCTSNPPTVTGSCP